MKHSTILKFIAIFLCAASLLTLVGSGLGLLCMVELDLYNQTVDQFLSKTYEGSAQFYGRSMAQQYASMTLGGCPEALTAQQYYGEGFEHRFTEGGIGYAIWDSEGALLTESNPAIQGSASHTFRFPVEGNYLHLVSAELDKKHTPQVDVADIEGLAEGEYGIIDRVGEGQAPVYSIQISYKDGSEGVGSDEPLGWLNRAESGAVHFEQAGGIGLNLFGATDITHITFLDIDGSILYEVADTKPVATVLQDSSGSHFIALLYGTDSGYPIGDPAWRPVYQANFYGSDLENPIEVLKGTQPIGAARLNDEGHLEFNLYIESSKLKDANGVFSLVLMDETGTVLFGQAQPQLQTATSDGMTFTSSPDAIAVALPTEAASAEAVQSDAPEAASAEEAPAEAPPTEETPAEAPAAQSEDSNADAIAVETMPPEAPATEPTVVATIPETVAATVPETLPATIQETTAPTEPVIINGKPLDHYSIDTYGYYDPITQQHMLAKTVYLAMPAYTVEVFIQQDLDQNAHTYSLMGLLRQYSGLLLPALLGSLLVLALTLVHLCVSAGHRRTGEIKAGGLNRIPLDLYLLLCSSAVIGLGALTVVAVTDLLPKNMEISLVLIPLMTFLICLITVAFFFAAVSQGKTPGGYWWRNTLGGRLMTGGVGSLGKAAAWTSVSFFPWLGHLICKLWNLFLLVLKGCYDLLRRIWRKIKALIHDFLRWVFYAIKRFFSLLPLTWQWLLAGMVVMFLGVLVWCNRWDGWGMLWLLAGLALILYISHCFGVLLERTKKMNQGDLESKIDDRRMVGCFHEFARDLNNLADVVVVAAQKQLRSERMKTELITNVSHDIKTPLTSIINYVDLLQKPHTQDEGQQYLEVLDRQSQRLKKLIDDLMDMSKASTGNMNVEISHLDAVESVNQALGEFADKLDRAELTPVFRHNTDEAFIMADGKLLWRVLSNLLGNAVKYAMPGTRLYVDLMNLDGRVIISLKNISRDELNVDAEELMERFVRGDDSRNTEGSGLGLNIAKSLMELQKGHLQLLVDGDLFKVTLVFPTAE